MGKEPTGSLRKGCLNFTELTSVAIALISPTMTAALIVPLMYSSAGNASWLAYLFGTVMLLFVALNLNQFARRSSSAGSMFAYTVMGLGPAAGGISGWCLVWAYLFIGTAGMTGFTIFANTLFGMMGFQVPNIVIFAACAAVIWFLAYKDIRLSTILMLVIEVVDNLARPFSLGIRLFANMFADHHVLNLFTSMTYLGVPVLLYMLGLLVCVVQAFVFVLLSMIYVLMASHEH